MTWTALSLYHKSVWCPHVSTNVHSNSASSLAIGANTSSFVRGGLPACPTILTVVSPSPLSFLTFHRYTTKLCSKNLNVVMQKRAKCDASDFDVKSLPFQLLVKHFVIMIRENLISGFNIQP